MSSLQIQHLQKQFIEAIADEGDGVTIYLNNGVKLEGDIERYELSEEQDRVVSLVLIRDGKNQLIFCNSIATVMPVSRVYTSDFYAAELSK